MSLNFKTLVTRTITAGVFVAVLMFCIIYDALSFQALFFVVSSWGLWEYFRLMGKSISSVQKVASQLLGASLYLFSTLYIWNTTHPTAPLQFLNELLITPLILFLLLIGFDLIKKKNYVGLMKAVLGMVYVTFPFIVLNFLAFGFYSTNTEITYSSHLTLGMFYLIWLNDSGAYLVGSSFGKHKLYESISPGKTWEGTIGGMLIAVGLSYTIWTIFPEFGLKHWISIAIIVSIIGTIGDLFESKLKRSAGFKDSGSIMPGHGGILDRFDSLIFSAPFVYLYLLLFN